MTADNLKNIEHRYRDYERSLSSLEAVIKESQADLEGVVGSLVSIGGGNDGYASSYQNSVSLARNQLDFAKDCLNQGSLQIASRSLQRAERFIKNIEARWLLERENSIRTAETVVFGLKIMRNASAGFVLTGGVGTIFGTSLGAAASISGGLHAAGLTVAVEVELLNPVRWSAPGAEPGENGMEISRFPEKTKTEQQNVHTATKEKTRKATLQKPPPVSESEDVKTGEEKKSDLEKRQARMVRNVRRRKKEEACVSRKKLIRRALHYLDVFRQGDKSLPPDFGDFFIQTECSPPVGNNNARLWEGQLKQYRNFLSKTEAGEGEEKKPAVWRLVQKLFDDYLHTYVLSNAGLGDFVEGKGGNCEAQTKLVLGAVAATGVSLPEGWIPGVQNYRDHIQPVLVHTGKRSVLNLITGKTTDKIEAPVYHPHLLIDAFLMSAEGKSPVTPEDFLIFPESEEYIDVSPTETYFSNTNLHIRGGRGRFDSGPVSPYAFVSKPRTWMKAEGSERTEDFSEAGVSASVPGGGGMWRYPDTKLFARKDLDPKNKKRLENSELKDFEAVTYLYEGRGSILVFDDEADLLQYRSLPDDEEKKQFIIDRTYRKTKSHPISGIDSLKYLAGVLKNPLQMNRENPERIREHAQNGMKYIRAVLLNMRELIRYVFSLPHAEASGYVYNEILKREPFLAEWFAVLHSFQRRVTKYPTAFLLFYDRLNPKERRAFKALSDIARADIENIYNPSGDAMSALAHKMRDKRLFSVGAKPGYAEKQTPKMPDFSFDEEFFPVAFYEEASEKGEEPSGGKDKKEIAEQKGKKIKKSDIVSKRDSRYRLKPETVIELMLMVPGVFYLGFFWERKDWRPEYAAVLRRMNREGEYDRLILNNVNIAAEVCKDAETENVWEGFRKGDSGEYRNPYPDFPFGINNRKRFCKKKLSRDVVLLFQDIKKRQEK